MGEPNRDLPSALAGGRVIEIGAGLPVEMVGQLLHQLGAEVTKVERPGTGSLSTGLTYACLNRGKQIRPIDLKAAVGVSEFHALVDQSHVLIQGYSEGAAARLGIDFDSIQARRPAIVYCEITGYSSADRRAGRPGHDPTYLAAAGLIDPAAPAGWTGLPFALADHLGALYAALAVLAAAGTGGPSHLQVSLRDAALSAAQQRVNDYLADPQYDLTGARAGIGTFRTRDGVPLMLAAVEPHFFDRLVDLLGLDALVDVDELAPAGGQHGRLVNRAIADRVAELAWADLSTSLDEARIPYERVDDLGTALARDQIDNPSLYGRLAGGGVFMNPPVLTWPTGARR
jgi:crotonobetainyl-CoA:carnitine CoA-transferase CaiB-like acyl-CoA transferase